MDSFSPLSSFGPLLRHVDAAIVRYCRNRYYVDHHFVLTVSLLSYSVKKNCSGGRIRKAHDSDNAKPIHAPPNSYSATVRHSESS